MSLLAFCPHHCHFAAFRSLKSCLGRFLMNFATFKRKTKIYLLLCLIYIFKGRFQNKNRITSAASRHFAINGLNKLKCQKRENGLPQSFPFFIHLKSIKSATFPPNLNLKSWKLTEILICLTKAKFPGFSEFSPLIIIQSDWATSHFVDNSIVYNFSSDVIKIG